MPDGRVALGWEIPIEDKEALKEEANKRGMSYWEYLHQLISDSLGLEDASTEAAYRRKLGQLDQEIESLETKKERIENELEQKRADREFYQDGLDEILENKASYEEQLDEILGALEDSPNKRVIAFRSQIKEAAKDEYGSPTESNLESVREDLWDRAMDQTREVKEYQFKEGTGESVPLGAAADGGNDRRMPASLRKAKEGKLGESDEDSSEGEETDDKQERSKTEGK
jgi:predicted DNA binding CopG/RHH family protein